MALDRRRRWRRTDPGVKGKDETTPEQETTMNATTKIDMSKPVLYRYEDAQELRNATAEELAESIEAAKHDGGAGVITVDDVGCYVQE
jgi:paraquat-inducible protein B